MEGVVDNTSLFTVSTGALFHPVFLIVFSCYNTQIAPGLTNIGSLCLCMFWGVLTPNSLLTHVDKCL